MQVNKVSLLQNDVIYVEKVGDQTQDSLIELFRKISKLATNLRAQNKRVLILSNAANEGTMDIHARQTAAKIGSELDYDKSATYGSSVFLKNLRKYMIEATKLDQKVANFATREEAEVWLMK